MPIRHDTPTDVRTRVVIEVHAKRGLGTLADPIRMVRQYWALDNGELLAEQDKHVVDTLVYMGSPN